MTTELFLPIHVVYTWVHRAAHLLANPAQLAGEEVRHQYDGFLEEMHSHQAQADSLSSAVSHFLKVTASYAPNLFTCYDHPALPRTNNDLEQTFGRVRHHERRVTGRKSASPLLVVRGPVHVIASVVTSARQITSSDLQMCSLPTWSLLRQQVESRRRLRSSQRRFRRDPLAFLSSLEHRLSMPILPL